MISVVFIWLFLWALWLVWLATARQQPPSSTAPLPAYAVVIPARNEAQHLGDTLKSILAQSPPPAAVFVMDDHSTDTTAAVVKSMRHPSLFLHSTLGHGKKAALREGYILAYPFPRVFFTDADTHWLPGAAEQLLVTGAPSHVAMVCGEVAYRSAPHVAAAFARADMDGMMRTGRGLALRGFPFVCSGACLALQPAMLGPQLPDLGPGDSGDDVFLLHALTATHGRNAIAWIPQTLVEVPAIPNLKTLWRTRLRWAGKTSRYVQNTAQRVSLWIWLMHFIGLVLVFFHPLWVLGGKLLLDLAFFRDKMRGRHALTSLVYFVYIPILPVISWFTTVTWKQRAVKKS
jgi:glycosyltransferase involved in cell wall biosynthesis